MYYGSLAAVAVLLVWLFLTSLVLLVGAEVNAMLEGVGAHEYHDVGEARPACAGECHFVFATSFEFGPRTAAHKASMRALTLRMTT